MRRPLHIEYHRPPDRTVTYVQDLIVDVDEVKISFQEAAPIADPLTVGGRAILEPGSPVIWFTFPGRWHDIGRFHLADGAFTGIYANVLTPVELHDATPALDGVARWRTTDLFLDIWMGKGEPPLILDEDEWTHARQLGHLEPDIATRARHEADALLVAARAGEWPPAVVEEWTLEKARSYVAEG